MTNPATRTTVNKHTADLYADLLPAVAFVKAAGLNDGHSASSKARIFEAFFRRILTELRQQPNLWESAAVSITIAEGGGYDPGYIQPVEFFGGGPRIPLIVVSRYDTGGHLITTMPTTRLSGISSSPTASCRRSPTAAAITCQTPR